MAQRFRNLVELCERSCATFATRPLYGTKRPSGWSWTSYREFHDLVARFRAGLASIGVRPGDRVAIVSDNRVEWAVAAHATYGLEAAFVPMYQAQRPEEWRYILDDCEAKVVIAANDEVHRALFAMHAQLPNLETIVGLERPSSDPRSFAALLDAPAVPARSPDPDSIADFIYTSGTTGKPKGVLLSHHNIATNVSAVHEVFTFEPDDRSLAFLPWAHAYGQTCEVHGLMSMGCSVAINRNLSELLDDLRDVKPTILIAVPRIFNRIYEGVNKQIAERPALLQRLIRNGIRGAVAKEHGDTISPLERVEVAFDEHFVFGKIRERFGGRLKYAISASATLGHEVAEFIDALGLTVYEGYGLTETSPIVAANFPGQRRFGSVGRVLPGIRVEIDRTVGNDPNSGEIIVHGPNVMVGYHRRPEENAKAFTPDGGLRTGDLGYVDDDGFLYVTGRIKEQYKLENGKYVMPSPLEEELKLSPFISNVMLYGDGRPYNVAVVVPNGEAIRAWAKEQGVSLSAELENDPRVRELLDRELRERSREFKSFERPRAFVVVAEDFTVQNGLLTPTLKLKRREAMSRYGALVDAVYTRAQVA